MKTLQKIIVILSVLMGLSSFISAEVVQDVDLETIVRVINSPTKNIVECEIGDTVIEYQWMKWGKKYRSLKGEVADKGIEQDPKGRDYNFVIVYFKNSDSTQGNFIKFTQYPNRKSSLFLLSGISTVDLPAVQWRMTKDSWADTYEYQEAGGYKHISLIYAAL